MKRIRNFVQKRIGWISYKLPYSNMYRINLFSVCKLYEALQELRITLEADPDSPHLVGLINGQEPLRELLIADELPLRLSRDEGHSLRTKISVLADMAMSVMTQSMIEKPELMGVWSEFKRLYPEAQEQSKKFFKALEVELGDLHVYSLPDIGLFGINRLMDAGALAFDNDTKAKIGGLILDEIREAGRCLAFNLYTACGFHLLRGTEGLIKRYMRTVGCSKEEIKSSHSWNDYANHLRSKAKADPSIAPIIRLIDTIREHHRNPIMHPEDSLDESEAVSLLAICQTLIQSMTRNMPDKLISESE